MVCLVRCLSRRTKKTIHHREEHRLFVLAMTLPIGVFVDVPLKVPIRDAPVNALDGVLRVRPKALHLVCVNLSSVFPVLDVLPGSVVDRVVFVAFFLQGVVHPELIGKDLAAFFDVFSDNGKNRSPLAVGNDSGDDSPAPLDGTEDRALVGTPAPLALASEVAPGVAEIRFIKLDLPGQRALFIQPLPDSVAHTKGRRIANADLSLDLFGGNAGSGLGELEDDVEPVKERNPRRFKDGAHERVGKRSATLATKRLAIRPRIVRRDTLATPARDAVRPATFPDEGEALRGCAEEVEEVSEGESVVHGPYLCGC